MLEISDRRRAGSASSRCRASGRARRRRRPGAGTGAAAGSPGRRRGASAGGSAHDREPASAPEPAGARGGATAPTQTGKVRVPVNAGQRDVHRGLHQERSSALDGDRAAAVSASVSRRGEHRRSSGPAPISGVSRSSGPFDARACRTERRRNAVAPARVYAAAPPPRQRLRRALRDGRSSRRWRAARTAGRSPTPTSNRCWRSTRRPQEGDIRRTASSARCAAAGEPRVPVPDRARSAGRPAGAALPHQRSRTRLAAVVLPLEQHPRRGAARRSPSAGSCATRRCSTRRCAG